MDVNEERFYPLQAKQDPDERNRIQQFRGG
jgi:hypothetical protein